MKNINWTNFFQGALMVITLITSSVIAIYFAGASSFPAGVSTWIGLASQMSITTGVYLFGCLISAQLFKRSKHRKILFFSSGLVLVVIMIPVLAFILIPSGLLIEPLFAVFIATISILYGGLYFHTMMQLKTNE